MAGELDVSYLGRDDAAFAAELKASLQPPEREVATSTPRSLAWLLALLLLLFAPPDLRGVCLSVRELRALGRAA